MEPLDLRRAPPRAPREALAGVLFLPRSIDKVRATLPGGDLGEYKIEGHTQVMFETLGVSLQRVTDIVARSRNDAAIADELLAEVTPQAIQTWNEFVVTRLPRSGDRAAAIVAYPWLANRPDLVYSLDVIAEDDRVSFAPPPTRAGA